MNTKRERHKDRVRVRTETETETETEMVAHRKSWCRREGDRGGTYSTCKTMTRRPPYLT
jgi:hypothetical protein